jgi:hypothetical protein
MAEALCVYREVVVLRASKSAASDVAIWAASGIVLRRMAYPSDVDPFVAPAEGVIGITRSGLPQHLAINRTDPTHCSFRREVGTRVGSARGIVR